MMGRVITKDVYDALNNSRRPITIPRHLAQRTKQTESVAKQIGDVIRQGRKARALAKAGIVFSESEMARLGGISQSKLKDEVSASAERQRALLDQIRTDIPLQTQALQGTVTNEMTATRADAEAQRRALEQTYRREVRYDRKLSRAQQEAMIKKQHDDAVEHHGEVVDALKSQKRAIDLQTFGIEQSGIATETAIRESLASQAAELRKAGTRSS